MLRAAHTARSTASRLWQLRSAPRSRRSRSDRSSTNASQQVVCQQYVESGGPCSSDPATAGLGGNRSVSLPTTSCRNWTGGSRPARPGSSPTAFVRGRGVSEPPPSQSKTEGRLATDRKRLRSFRQRWPGQPAGKSGCRHSDRHPSVALHPPPGLTSPASNTR